MLTIFSAIFGFAAPLLPKIFDYFQRKQDNAHELQVLNLRSSIAAQEQTWRMAEINAKADAVEQILVHKTEPSFGIALLDAVAKLGWGKVATIPAFYIFIILDFLTRAVRPAATYAMFSFYIFYKIALFNIMIEVSDASFTWANGISRLWSEEDWAFLTLVASYWFGHRALNLKRSTGA